MLVDFEVENFRSYREPKRFSFVASSIKESAENLVTVPEFDLRILKTAAIYGANGSGKSNLLLAMQSLSLLLDSPINRRLSLRLDPFILDTESSVKPVRFRTRFLADKTLFEYEVAVQHGIVEKERLVAYPKGRPQEWFSRIGSDIEFPSPNLKGQKKSLLSVTSEESLFLAIANAFGHSQLSIPANWLITNLVDRFSFPRSRNRLDPYRNLSSAEATARRIQTDLAFHQWADGFMRHADIGIEEMGVRVSERKVRRAVAPRDLQESNQNPIIEVFTEEEHRAFFIHSGEGEKTAEIDLSNESQGTRRLFSMLAPIYEALKNGELAVIDELSASLHPTLVRELIRAFHSPVTNPKNAQLLFATHDATLLSGRIFRRDQIWFTEKSPVGSTDLYSLHDIKDVRSEESFEDGYLRGRYGAIPFFSAFDFPKIEAVPEPSERPTSAGPKSE